MLTQPKMERLLAQLHPVCHAPLETLIQRAAHELGLSLTPFDAHRGDAAQNAALASGASKKPAGKSWHNLVFPGGRPCSFAVHVRIDLPDGGGVGFGDSRLEYPGAVLLHADIWRDKVGERLTARQLVYVCVMLLAEEIGWTTGGRWSGLQDWCHLEWHPNGATMEQVKAALLANEVIAGRRA